MASMTSRGSRSGTSADRAGTIGAVSADQSFDQWVRDEGGPEAVVAMVEDVKRQADEGLLPGFSDKEEFLTHLVRRGRRSA